MIHEGTMKMGSACTVAVWGAYWISSAKWLRCTTRPGVTATFTPGV